MNRKIASLKKYSADFFELSDDKVFAEKYMALILTFVDSDFHFFSQKVKPTLNYFC